MTYKLYFQHVTALQLFRRIVYLPFFVTTISAGLSQTEQHLLSHLSIQLGRISLLQEPRKRQHPNRLYQLSSLIYKAEMTSRSEKITTEISPNLVEKTLLPVTVYRPSIAGTYSIAVRDIRLSGKDKTGNNLDALSLPDPFVRVFLGTQFIFESKTWQDTLTAEGCRTQKLLIPDSTALTIQLLDADVLQLNFFSNSRFHPL